MNNQRMLSSVRNAPLTLLALMLCSCGPLYETRYSFTPPRDYNGRSCVISCETSRLQCKQLQQMQYNTCEQQSRLEQDRCEFNIRLEGREPKWYECSSSYCSNDTESCESTYRNCYQLCGGSVIAEDVCVANCEVPQQQPARPRR